MNNEPHIDFAFLVIAATIGLLALFIWSVRARLGSAAAYGDRERARNPARDGSFAPALRSGWAMLGAAAIFLYIGAEVFIGSALLTRVRAALLLAAAAAVAAILCLTVTRAPGELAGWAALSVGLFNSIMFPVIFTLTLERSTASGAATSGLLCMAIVGGAVMPPLVGRLADVAGLRAAYLVALIACACISAFAVAAFMATVASQLAVASNAAH